MLLLLTAFFLFLYAALIFYYFYHWLHIKSYSPGTGSTFISIVVAARNEEGHIAELLRALQNQSYPKHLYEIIIVDDFSTDNTAALVKQFLNGHTKLITPTVNPNLSSKKKAIEAGINAAKGELIAVTDADCIPPTEWLQTISHFQQKENAVFIAAPVQLKAQNSLLGIFQSLDFITLQGITAASVQANFHSMCNGANLAYLRSSFFEAGGFKGIDKVASGDDMLLMYKIWKKNPADIRYLKGRHAIVKTEPVKTWKDFFRQRIRWSSKAAYYDDKRVMWVLFFVYLFNCLFFVLLIAFLFDAYNGWVLLFYLAGKVLVELPFVYSVARFFKEEKRMAFFPFLQPLHILYTVTIGLISQFGNYEWKGRKTK